MLKMIPGYAYIEMVQNALKSYFWQVIKFMIEDVFFMLFVIAVLDAINILMVTEGDSHSTIQIDWLNIDWRF